MNDNYYFINIAYSEGAKNYAFSTVDKSLEVGDYVIVENNQTLSIARVVTAPKSVTQYNNKLALKEILRKATDLEVSRYKASIEDAVLVLAYCQKQVDALDLKMSLLSAEYSFDRSKIFITYAAEERVDFRELIKILGSYLKTRVELRQIGARDRAQLIGGIGACGFPLCCATFLNEFDGISISRAKNQMLSLNIPKLSGHCSKLLCCLKFEDDYYTEARPEFPAIGARFSKNKVMHRVTSFNMISRTVRVDFEGGSLTLPLDELKRDYVRINEKG